MEWSGKTEVGLRLGENGGGDVVAVVVEDMECEAETTTAENESGMERRESQL